MKKLADILAFLFLSTLVSCSGLLLLRAQAQFANTDTSAYTAPSSETTSADETNANADTNGTTQTSESNSADAPANTVTEPTAPDTTNTVSGDSSSLSGQPETLGTFIIKSIDARTKIFTVSSTPPNESLNIWTVRTVSTTSFFDNGSSASFSSLQPERLIDIFGTRDTLSQSIVAIVINVREATTPAEPTSPSNEPESSTGSEDVTEPESVDETRPENTPDEETVAEESVLDRPERPGQQPTDSEETSDTPTIQTAPISPTAGAPAVAREQEYCETLGIVDSIQCQQILELDIHPRCLENSIASITACNAFLQTLERSNECADPLSASCARGVVEEIRDELVCGSFNRTDCEKLATESFSGIIANELKTRETISAVIAQREGDHTTARDISDRMAAADATEPKTPAPLTRDHTVPLLVLPSRSAIDVSSGITAIATAPFALTVDTDRDGVPDDLEKLYATDLNNPDSDGDGYTDRDELLNGYDPLSTNSEKTARVLSPTELSILRKASLEQPVGRRADQALNLKAEPTLDATGIVLSGKATPRSVILVYIYSKLPLVLTVATDDLGNWTYRLTDPLTDGKHTAYVALTNESGTIQSASNPLAFFVREAQAVAPTSFIEDQPIIAGDTSDPLMRWYLFGGVGLMVLALIIILIVVRSRIRANA